MTGALTALVAAALLPAMPALVDQPPAVPPPTVCSLKDTVCVTRTAGGVTVWRKLRGGRRAELWRAPARGPNLQVADDGQSLVEGPPSANLIDAGAGPGATMLTFYRPGRPPVRVTLGELIRNIPALPRTVSHRSWARTLGYDGRGHFQVDTVEGRRILFDPATGRTAAR